MGKFIELKAADGHKLAAYVAQPSGKARGGVVVIPEIFGVNSHIQQTTDGFAADGYLAVSPAMFDRAQRNYDTGYSQPEIQAGVAIMQKLDWKQAMLDVAGGDRRGGKGRQGRHRRLLLRRHGDLGGRGTGQAASPARCPTTAAACPASSAKSPRCRRCATSARLDQSPTLAQAKEIVAKHPGITAHFYAGAGHGFNCDQRGSWNAEAAKLARSRTVEFFRKHLG